MFLPIKIIKKIKKTTNNHLPNYTIWTWQEKFKKNNQFLSEKRAEKWWANLQDPYFDEMNYKNLN